MKAAGKSRTTERILKGAAANILPLLPHRIVRPVFIVAPPRSGSTLLVEALSRLDTLTGFTRQEADHIWWRVLPYSARSAPDDKIEAADLNAWQRRKTRALFYREAAAAQPGSGLAAGVVGRRPIRYLDKTISNCFHLDLLDQMFPDATFVYLLRDPRANIASMIRGWAQPERFGKPALTPHLRRAPDATIEWWAYPAPPGWRSVVAWDLPAICAWSWQQHVNEIIRFRAMAPGQLVRYEDLVARPTEVVKELAQVLNVGFSATAQSLLETPPLSSTTVTPPSPDKWRRLGDEIERVMPMVADTAELIGY